MLLWLTLGAWLPRLEVRAPAPVLTVTVPRLLSSCPHPRPCKLRTEEARAPWACPLRPRSGGGTALLCRKAACVSHSSAHEHHSVGRGTGLVGKQPYCVGVTAGRAAAPCTGFPGPARFFHRDAWVWGAARVTGVREHGSWRERASVGLGAEQASQTEAGQSLRTRSRHPTS